MEKNVTASKHSRGASKGIGFYFLRIVITGISVFAICILLMPLLLMRSNDPASFVSAAAGATVAITAFFCGFAAAKGSSKHFLVTGAVSALVLCALITGLSFLFDNGSSEKDIAFSVIIYVLTTVLSIVGAAFASKKTQRKKKKRRR